MSPILSALLTLAHFPPQKIEEQRITMEDLEALKELEENDIQVERELRDEILDREKDLREEKVRVGLLEDIVSDADGTITRLREVVADMQEPGKGSRAGDQKARGEGECGIVGNCAVALILHQETEAVCKAARPYLPQQYVESDSDATNCYLFFARLGYKTDFINTIVGLAHGLPDSLNGVVSETLVGICEMRGRAASFSTLCKRFASILRWCDLTSFLNFGRIYPGIAPMGRRIDLHIDLLRRDEFREMEFVSCYFLSLLFHVDEWDNAYFDGFEQDLGERELGYALSFDHDLDVFAASIGLTKTSVAVILNDEDVVLDIGGYDLEGELIEPLQKLLEQCKSAKLLSKKLMKRPRGRQSNLMELFMWYMDNYA
ncbi:dynein associated protein-domain-containing protein [Suillus americanus]|nr:dynein associated protein-domain-containing protein [Suillus americanus]